MAVEKSNLRSIMWFIHRISVAELARIIEEHGIFFEDDLGRLVKAPEESPNQSNSVKYVIERLKLFRASEMDYHPNLDDFDRSDEDPMNKLGWDKNKLPLILKSLLEDEKKSTKNQAESNFIPLTPQMLAELFTFYTEKQWKRLSKSCKKTPWLTKALAVESIGRTPNTYYPDIIGEELVLQGKLSSDKCAKILYRIAPTKLKDQYKDYLT